MSRLPETGKVPRAESTWAISPLSLTRLTVTSVFCAHYSGRTQYFVGARIASVCGASVHLRYPKLLSRLHSTSSAGRWSRWWVFTHSPAKTCNRSEFARPHEPHDLIDALCGGINRRECDFGVWRNISDLDSFRFARDSRGMNWHECDSAFAQQGGVRLNNSRIAPDLAQFFHPAFRL